MKSLIFVISVVFLASCSSIPLSTTIRLASMGDDAFSSIRPAELRVRISIEEPNELLDKDVNLVMKFENQDGSRNEYKYLLELLTIKAVNPVQRWFSSSKSKHAYEFKLTPLSQLEFSRYLKNRRQKTKIKKYFWTVYYYLKDKPIQQQTLTIDVELKFSSDDEYFYLLKNAPIEVDSK